MTVKAPIYSISRLRFGTDGKGITSLVAFMGCPLRCRHCINSWCHSDPSRARLMSPEEKRKEIREGMQLFIDKYDALWY